MSEKEKAKRFKWAWARHAVQVAVLLLFCLPLIASGWMLLGLFVGDDLAAPLPADFFLYGSLTASGLFGITLLDPLAFLETIVASKTFDPQWLLYVLPVAVFYAIIRGRAFCGWVCPVNLVLEVVDFIRRKLKIEVAERVLPRHLKMWMVLVVVVLSALTSVPVFEALSPLGIMAKGLALGSLAGVWTLVAIIVAELFWGHRVWCRAICPIGGVYELMGPAAQVNVAYRSSECIHCNKCKGACLADPEILDGVLEGDDAFVKAGDCMACGACIDACPTQALAFKLGRFGFGESGASEQQGGANVH